MFLQSRSRSKPRDILSTWHLHYYEACDHQTREGDDLLWRVFTREVAKPFQHLVTWGHGNSVLVQWCFCEKSKIFVLVLHLSWFKSATVKRPISIADVQFLGEDITTKLRVCWHISTDSVCLLHTHIHTNTLWFEANHKLKFFQGPRVPEC